MNQFRNETNNNFNKAERRLQFIETDYNQLNESVDNLERTGRRLIFIYLQRPFKQDQQGFTYS